jgi:hypothetical protein
LQISRMTLLWTSSMPPWTGLKSFTTQLDFDFFRSV